MGKLYYIGFYDVPENASENRNFILSASNKIAYIISRLDMLGNELTVVSASTTRNNRMYSQKKIKLGENSNLVLFKTLPWGNKIRRIVSVLYSHYQLLKYLMFILKKEDTVIVYHSLAYTNIIRLVKKIKEFNLILEIEEIYADVNGNERDRIKEYKLFDLVDAFIFPTELLNEKLNKYNKPYSIIYGTYQVEKDRGCKSEDGKIYCVYAGTFDSRKGGVIAAIDTALELDSNYHIFILGFGSKFEKKHVQEKIEKLSKICSCKITYEGLLSGEAYIRLIQKCDIGLSTQNPHAIFNDTSFPSKILSYMANGLRVVSINIPAIECSSVADYITYYDLQTSEEIAKAISSVDFSKDYDSREIIKELDLKFRKDLERILNVRKYSNGD